MNVLIVEDDRINAFILRKFVQENNNVFVGHSPLEAIEILRNNPIDLVLMDINLGNNELDGVELLEKVRGMDGYEDIPSIATTAYAMTGDKESLLAQGFSDYIAKPIKKDDLLQKIELVLTTRL